MRNHLSARDMSLPPWQNTGYINNIETGKALPSIAVFFAICDYPDITPMDFFDEASEQPEELRKLKDNMKKSNKRRQIVFFVFLLYLVRYGIFPIFLLLSFRQKVRHAQR